MNSAANTNSIADGNGSKYLATKDLNIKDVAKLVRADIKAASLGVTCSVTIDRFSGGQSLDIRVKACTVQIWTDEFAASNPREYFAGQRYTDEAQALLKALEVILQAYNYDRSDIQSDYFNVRFYGHAEFCYDLTTADRARTTERLAATGALAVGGL